MLPFLVQFLPSANEVCEGYVFTPVCNSVHRRWCLGACPGAGGLPRGSPGPGPLGWWPGLGGDVSQHARHLPSPPPPADGYCSYWNAFLFHLVFGKQFAKMISWRPLLLGFAPSVWEILVPPLYSDIIYLIPLRYHTFCCFPHLTNFDESLCTTITSFLVFSHNGFRLT